MEVKKPVQKIYLKLTHKKDLDITTELFEIPITAGKSFRLHSAHRNDTSALKLETVERIKRTRCQL